MLSEEKNIKLYLVYHVCIIYMETVYLICMWKQKNIKKNSIWIETSLVIYSIF